MRESLVQDRGLRDPVGIGSRHGTMSCTCENARIVKCHWTWLAVSLSSAKPGASLTPCRPNSKGVIRSWICRTLSTSLASPMFSCRPRINLCANWSEITKRDKHMRIRKAKTEFFSPTIRKGKGLSRPLSMQSAMKQTHLNNSFKCSVDGYPHCLLHPRLKGRDGHECSPARLTSASRWKGVHLFPWACMWMLIPPHFGSCLPQAHTQASAPPVPPAPWSPAHIVVALFPHPWEVQVRGDSLLQHLPTTRDAYGMELSAPYYQLPVVSKMVEQTVDLCMVRHVGPQH